MCNYVAYNRFYKRRFFTFISCMSGGSNDGIECAKGVIELLLSLEPATVFCRKRLHCRVRNSLRFLLTHNLQSDK